MNNTVGDVYTEELAELFQQQGQLLYDGQHSLCLTTPCLHFLQKRFSAIQERSTDPVPVKFAVLHCLQGCLAKVVSLKLITDKHMTLVSTATLNLEPFRALHTLVLKKVSLVSVTGLQRLRSQLRVLVIQRCHVNNIDDVIVRCGGDDSTSFVWDSLRELDLSSNHISQLGDSLQYLPGMEKVNFSNNYISSEGWESASLAEVQSSTIGGQGPSNESIVNATITNSYEGIVCLEKVTFLHLGFNKLRVVPRFASKAKYTLTVLNLRNNQLDTIEGVHELDRLAELDLTDNLIMKHSCLSPLKNLHHLSLLNLQGNPLCYHPKHRLKTAQYLSNLIDKNAFRLEGKKLSATEKKEISNFLTHYSGSPSFVIRSSASIPVATPSQHSYVGVASPAAENVQGTTPTERFSKALSINVLQEERVAAKKPRRKKSSKSVKIFDSDENQSPEDTAGKEELTVGSVPLMNEKHLNKIKLVRKQLEADWIKTINAVESSSTTDISSNQSFIASAQAPPSPKHSTPIRKSSLKKRDSLDQSVCGKVRERKSSRGKRRKRVGVPSVGAAECEGVSGGEQEEVDPMTFTPVDRVPTPSHIEGDYFLVERYESDVEDDDSLSTSGRGLGHSGRGWPVQGSRDSQMLIVLTERFIEEQTAKGKHIDRWDVNSLLEASIDKRPWKKGAAGEANILLLKFNLDRRDRCKREYVLLEEGVNDDLLGNLNAIVEQNQATLSVENKLECLHCQRIFDKSQAQEEVSNDTTPLPLGSYKNRSLATLVCPFCQSQVLQIATSLSSKSYKGAPSYSPSPRLTTIQTTPPSNTRNGIVIPSNERKAGFEISPSHPSREDGLKSTTTTEINGEAIFSTTHTSTKNDDSLQKDELQNSIDSTHSSGGFETHPFDFTGSDKLSSDPTGDLSPWKPDNSRTRARAGAVCVSTEQASTLQDSFKQHHQLHEEVRKSSPEIVRKNSQEVTTKRSEVSPTNETEVIENASTNPFDSPPPLSSSYSSSKRDKYFSDVVPKVPDIEISTSVPSGAHFTTYMADNTPTLSESTESTESHASHNRSKSVDYHPRKALNTTPPSQRKKYPDPYSSRDEDHTHRHTHSLGSVKEGESLRTGLDSNPASYSSSKKSSLVSLDDRDSPYLGRHDVEHSSQGYISSENEKKSKQNSRHKRHASGDTGKDTWENFFGSGESRKRGSFDRGYSSSEASQRSSHSNKGNLSSEGSKQRQNTVHRVRSQDDIKDPRKTHSDNASRRRGDAGSSSEEQRLTKTLYKEEDPTYIESNLNLFLDMEIFNLDKKESFEMVFRAPVVQYGRTTEMPALVVISNLSLYIFRVTAPENSDPSKWLELVSNHLLRRLVYIDIGVGYQLLRLEFRTDQLACYSFILRDEDKCTIISTKLAFIVSDVANSSFKTVGVCPFSMETIRYPKRALKEVLMVDYEQLSGRSTPTRGGRHTPTLGPGSRPGSSLARSHDDDELVLYRLVHKRVSARSQASGPTPVSLIITKTTIFLAKENFTHWPLPRIHELPPRDSLRPSYSEVQQRSVTDIDQIVLDRDQATQVTIRFFKECILEGEDRYWLLVMRKVSCVEKLVSSVSALWRTAFETDLPIIHK